MKRYWCRVFARTEDGKCDKWPEGVQGWCTGSDARDRGVWCLIVDAENEDEVIELLYSCWEPLDIESTTEKPLDWIPGARFPGAKAARASAPQPEETGR